MLREYSSFLKVPLSRPKVYLHHLRLPASCITDLGPIPACISTTSAWSLPVIAHGRGPFPKVIFVNGFYFIEIVSTELSR